MISYQISTDNDFEQLSRMNDLHLGLYVHIVVVSVIYQETVRQLSMRPAIPINI